MCTLCPHIGDAKELEVEDAMDAEDHGESVNDFFLERYSHGSLMTHESLSPIFVSSPVPLGLTGINFENRGSWATHGPCALSFPHEVR